MHRRGGSASIPASIPVDSHPDHPPRTRAPQLPLCRPSCACCWLALISCAKGLKLGAAARCPTRSAQVVCLSATEATVLEATVREATVREATGGGRPRYGWLRCGRLWATDFESGVVHACPKETIWRTLQRKRCSGNYKKKTLWFAFDVPQAKLRNSCIIPTSFQDLFKGFPWSVF